jgi:sugar diacid utilization regulator/predicted hydrocarbon binding protein
MILVGSNAFGALRRDLIRSVGMDQAKKILLRYGRNYGVEFAKNLKALYSFESPFEWFHAGPQMSKITGAFLSQNAQIIYNRSTGEYFGEGYWHNSYEAEQHLKHFGIHNEPVCYTLSGFVGGYASEHYGTDIIVKEIKCVGKGDEYCHMIAKPAKEWEESDLLDQLEQDNKEVIEISSPFLKIEKQRDVYKRLLKFNEQLTEILAREQGLSSIIKILGETLNLSVALEDKDFKLLESFGLFKYNMLDIIKFKNHILFSNQLKDIKKPVHYTFAEGAGWSHERLICPIYTKNGLFGYISLIKDSGQFDETEYLALEAASKFCSIQLIQTITKIEVEHNLKNELLNELLKQNCNVEELLYRSKLMGYNLESPHYLFIIHFISDLPNENQSNLQVQIIDAIHTQIKSVGSIKQCLLTNMVDHIVALIPLELLEVMGVGAKAFAQLLLKTIQSKYKDSGIMLGISSLCKEVKDYRRGYEEAQKAIQISTIQKKQYSSIVSFEDLSTFSKILNPENIDELKNFADSLLQGIKEYDEKHNSQLLKTLFYYLENQGNIQNTSHDLHISIGATRYRLKRIQEISKLDLTVSKDFYEAHLAMQILIFIDGIDIY